MPSELAAAFAAAPRRPRGSWTLERLKASTTGFDTQAEWVRAHPQAYAAAYQKGVLDEVLGDKRITRRPRHPNGFWTLETLKASTTGFSSQAEWQRARPEAFVAAQQKGLLDEVLGDRRAKGGQSWNKGNKGRVTKGAAGWVLNSSFETSEKYIAWEQAVNDPQRRYASLTEFCRHLAATRPELWEGASLVYDWLRKRSLRAATWQAVRRHG